MRVGAFLGVDNCKMDRVRKALIAACHSRLSGSDLPPDQFNLQLFKSRIFSVVLRGYRIMPTKNKGTVIKAPTIRIFLFPNTFRFWL